MTVFAIVLSSCLVIAWVTQPMLRPASLHGNDLEGERIQSLFGSLKKLQRDADKMAEDDFGNIERRIMLEIARVYHQTGVKAEVDGHACGHCGNPIRRKDKFCVECGQPVETHSQQKDDPAAASSCDSCGKEIESSHKFCPHCGVAASN